MLRQVAANTTVAMQWAAPATVAMRATPGRIEKKAPGGGTMEPHWVPESYWGRLGDDQTNQVSFANELLGPLPRPIFLGPGTRAVMYYV